MKPVLILVVIILTACNPIKRLTGSKPNGSSYVLTLSPHHQLRDSAIISGAVRVVGSASGENIAARKLHIIKLDTSDYRSIVEPDEQGRFTCKVAPGRYYLFFAGVGFGKMKTAEFYIKARQAATLSAVLHPEVETVCEYYIPSTYKTVPRRRNENQ